ncbi:MAG TPA: hypothetical protein VIH93_13480, partial [Thermoanaerobaculia bacterium]
MTIRQSLCATTLLLAAPLLALPARALPPPAPGSSGSPAVTLEQIMAAADWIGNPPEHAYWGDDGRAVYYERKRPWEELRDLVRLDLRSGTPRVVPPAEKGTADAPGGDWSRDRKWKVYAWQGDLFLKSAATGKSRQLTRTAEEEREPRFMTGDQRGDQRISFRRGDGFFVFDLATGLVSQPVDVRLAKDPADEDDPTYLKAEQLRLFDVLRKRKSDRDAARAEDRAAQRTDATRPPLPFYLGDKLKIVDAALSPSGDWLLLVTAPKDAKGGKDAKDSKDSKDSDEPHTIMPK